MSIMGSPLPDCCGMCTFLVCTQWESEESKNNNLRFSFLINQRLGSNSSHSASLCCLPILNINTDNKPLFPWALCDSSKLLLFTSCMRFGTGSYWKATAHSAQRRARARNSSDAGIQEKRSLCKGEQMEQQCSKQSPLPWCEEIMKGVLERTRAIERV